LLQFAVVLAMCAGLCSLVGRIVDRAPGLGADDGDRLPGAKEEPS
jgi:hypothetical protein